MGKPLVRTATGAALCIVVAACSGNIEGTESDDPGGLLTSPSWGVAGSGAAGGGALPGSGLPGSGLPGSGLPGSGLPGAPGVAGSRAGLDPNGNPASAPGTTSELRCDTPAVGPSPLRRLTHTEYDNSVRDLLGDVTQPARAFAPDTQVGLFDNTATAQTVPALLGDQYIETAATLAQNANISTLLGCDAADPGCVQGFIERFGRRAYRRPLSSQEVTRLLTTYDDVRSVADADMGTRAVVAAVMASPNFLFRPEFGGGPSTVPSATEATPFELAARLASLLWASVPDDVLLDAAAAGQLATREQVAEQARRMLDDDRARSGMETFYTQWLGLPLLANTTKDPAAYPRFDDALRDAMDEETRRFVAHVLWDDDARLSTLLTASYSFVNEPLAELYGVSPPSGGGFGRVELDPEQRRGLLTQASMLTTFASSNESSPVKRGKWVRVRVLCQDLPDPPADVPEVAAPQEGVSTRERFAMHTDNAACRGCHQLIDGLGFGLEAYDGIGAFRTMDHGVPVDASGEITFTEDADGTYVGGPELAMRLARSGQVRDCVPTQWLRFALGRRESEDDNCSLIALQQAFAASDGDLRELMVALTQTDAFWAYRQAE